MRLNTLISVWCLAATAIARKGSTDTSIIAHDGEPVGFEEVYNGVTMYVSKPRGSWKTAVLYMPDVFGIQLAQNKLLADSFARAGFLVVAPDFFNGTPAPHDIDDPRFPDFDTSAFVAAHTPEVTDPIIEDTIDYMRGKWAADKIAAAGYCFGGRYSFRFAAEGRGVDVAFAAHPSLLDDDDITGVVQAVSVAAAENDSLLPPEQRHNLEALVGSTGVEFQFSLYGGTGHGFGVRANVTDPRQKFAKENAFFQAVRWFEAWA